MTDVGNRWPYANLRPRGRSSVGECAWRIGCLAAGWLIALLLLAPGAAQASGVSTAQIDDGLLYSIACPTESQCTATGSSNGEITGRVVSFNPTSPGTPTPTTIDSDADLYGIACPSSGQCTAVNIGSSELTFNPASPLGTLSEHDFNMYGGLLSSVACPSESQCTAVDDFGEEVTFDPDSPNDFTSAQIDSGHELNVLTSVACPSGLECVAVDDSGDEMTFDPLAPGAPAQVPIDAGVGLSDVACPSETQCTAVDGVGREVTFDPADPGTPTPARLTTEGLSGIACPSADQCTAVGDSEELTFDPLTSAAPAHVAVKTGGVIPALSGLSGIACPSTSQCTAIDGVGLEITFDPLTVSESASPGTGGSSGTVTPPAESGAGGGSSSQPSNATISPARLRSWLAGRLAASESRGRSAALLKADGSNVKLTGMEPGSAVIDWYGPLSPRKLAKKKAATRTLVAVGRVAWKKAEKVEMRVKLTRAGRELLEHAARLTLTAEGTFTPADGGAAVSVRRTFVVIG